MISTFVYKCFQGIISVSEDWFWPNRNIYSTRNSLDDPLFVPQYLVMHSSNQFCIEDLIFIMMYLWKLSCRIILNISNINSKMLTAAICIIGLILLCETDTLEVVLF